MDTESMVAVVEWKSPKEIAEILGIAPKGTKIPLPRHYYDEIDYSFTDLLFSKHRFEYAVVKLLSQKKLAEMLKEA